MIRRFGTVKAGRRRSLDWQLDRYSHKKISSRVWRGFQFPAFTCAEVADAWQMSAFSAAWPLLRKEKAATVCSSERRRRRHEDTCIAPRMRIDEIYEQYASSPAARGGVKPTCVSITAGSFLERTHRRVRCPPTVSTVQGTAGDPSRVALSIVLVLLSIVSVWRGPLASGSGGLETPRACPQTDTDGETFFAHPGLPA